jgi:Glycosyl transferase family 11
VLFFHATGGRLGNQLFQAALIEKRRKPGEMVVTVLMAESKAFLTPHLRYRDLSNPFLVNIADHVVMKAFMWPLINMRVISSMIEDDRGVTETRGILPFTYFRGYFQAPRFIAPTPICRTWIRRQFRESAAARIRHAEGRTPVFLHVRRSDYRSYYKADGKRSALLPLDYYDSAIRRLRESVANPHFFLMGDDADWCERQFPELPHKTVSRGAPCEDLALMSFCAGGIVSNSSFAWWGAQLCERTAPIIAPRYWFGWAKRQWLPQGMEESDFQFIDAVQEMA